MDLQAPELRRPPRRRCGPCRSRPPSPGAGEPPPPTVYRVEPREFRDLVQRLTGAPPAAAAPRPQHQPVAVRVGGPDQHLIYGASPWFSFPLDGASAGLM